ncbi:MAG: DUF3868 domain-containing protein [Bacteroidales bacterium]|nr:DUF3868 domain-containing protein [Bacteroidales bacterium]
MRKFYIIPCIILLACGALNAQKSGSGDIAVSDLRMVVVNGSVEISFTAMISNKATKSSYTLFAVPTLTNNVTRLPLAAIVVQGKRAQVAEKRYAMSRTYPGLGQPIYANNGQQVPYFISVPYESWMTNVSLIMDKYERGCCDDVVMPSVDIARNVVLSASHSPQPSAPQPVQAQPTPTPAPVTPTPVPVTPTPTPTPVPVTPTPVPVAPAQATQVPVTPAPAQAPQFQGSHTTIIQVPIPATQSTVQHQGVQPSAATTQGAQRSVVTPSVQSQQYPYYLIDSPDSFDDSHFSTADKLARHFSFISPITEYDAAKRKSRTGVLFDYNMPLNLSRGISRAQQSDLDLFIDENRDEALSIYFKQGSDVVDRLYADNGYALVDMISSIRAIQSSNDCRIVRVIIAGFASPEGPFLFNDRLAWERAVAVKEIMLNNTNLSNRIVSIYNGSVDWRGLYRLVAESDMYHKYQILNIIDLAPIVGDHRYAGRLDELKRLNGGEPYKYMLNNIFPLLRNAAYIKIYYENTNNTYIAP